MEKAREICLEMLDQRGYIIEEDIETQIVAYREEDNDRLVIILINTPKFNRERAEEYIGIMKNLNINHSIIIYRDIVTPSAKSIIVDSIIFDIELFNESELQYNITKHDLVPNHERIPNPIEFKRRYGSKYPTILRSDPVSRFYGFKRGDIIKITRNNGYVTYRYVR